MNVTFYEVSPKCPAELIELSDYEKQLFDAINNAGAVDVKLLQRHGSGGQLELNTALGHLRDLGYIERRNVEVAD